MMVAGRRVICGVVGLASVVVPAIAVGAPATTVEREQGAGPVELSLHSKYTEVGKLGDQASDSSVAVAGDDYVVTDTQGIDTPGFDPYNPSRPLCTQLEPTRVRCAAVGLSVFRARFGAGDDRLDAPLGPQVLYSAPFMGPGNDYLVGGAEASMPHGGLGDDVMLLGPGSDGPTGFPPPPGRHALRDDLWPENWIHARGDEGDDVLLGQEGADRMDGGIGDDVLDGGPDADYLSGGIDRPDEAPVAAGDDDLLLGGDGDDILHPAAGADVVDAGPGSDQVAIDPGEDQAVDRIACGSGRDWVEIGSGDVIAADCEAVEELVRCPEGPCEGTYTVRTAPRRGAARRAAGGRRSVVLAKQHFRVRRKAHIDTGFDRKRLRRALKGRSRIAAIRRIDFVQEADDGLRFAMSRR